MGFGRGAGQRRDGACERNICIGNTNRRESIVINPSFCVK